MHHCIIIIIIIINYHHHHHQHHHHQLSSSSSSIIIIINIIPIIITHLSFSSIEGYQRTYDHPHKEGDPLMGFEVIDEGFEHFHLYNSRSLRKIIIA
jgi:hypothetical protein